MLKHPQASLVKALSASSANVMPNLEALAVHNGGARLVVLALGDPHLQGGMGLRVETGSAAKRKHTGGAFSIRMLAPRLPGLQTSHPACARHSLPAMQC